MQQAAPEHSTTTTTAPAVRDISTRELGSALRQGWWKALLGLILGLALAFGFTASQTPSYSSVTTSLVHARSDDGSAAERLAAEELAKSRAATYESLGNSLVIADAVKQDLDLDVSAEELLEQVSVVSSPQTTGLEITASAASPDEAARLASAWREALAGTSDSDAAVDRVTLEPAGEPTVPQSPSGLSSGLVLAMGAAMGLLVGVIVAAATARPVVRETRRG